MKITVTVTEEHVKNQHRGDCEACAFALAVNEKLAEPFHANIFQHLRIENWAGYPLYWLKLPYQIRAVIQRLDDADAVDLPFSFPAIIPGKYLNTEAKVRHG